MSLIHPPILMRWDEEAREYVATRDAFCTARWRSGGGHLPGAICGRPGEKTIGDTAFCQHHYDRAMEWHYAELRRERNADDAAGWHVETREWDAIGPDIVYYLLRESDALIKIGTTTSFYTRLSQLKVRHGALKVLATHTGDRDCELTIHRKFDRARADGEWFQPAKPLRDWILKVRRHQRLFPEGSLYRGTLPYGEVAKLARTRPRGAMQRAS